MFCRPIATSLGFALLLSAPTALAAFPEDFSHDTVVEEELSSPTVDAEKDIPMIEIDLTKIAAPIELEPTATLTRRAFTALLVEKLYTQVQIDTCFWDIASSLPPNFTLVYTDVHVNDAYAKHICVALRDGLAKGYADGSFRPDRPINFAESAKMISKAMSLAPYADADQRSVWYRRHVQALADRHAIPLSITKVDQIVTVAEANEIVGRLVNNMSALPSRTYDELIPKTKKPVAPVKPKPPAEATGKGPAAATSAAAASSKATTSAKSSAVSSAPAAASSKAGGIWNPF